MALLIDKEEIGKKSNISYPIEDRRERSSLLKLIFFHYSPPKLSYIKGF